MLLPRATLHHGYLPILLAMCTGCSGALGAADEALSESDAGSSTPSPDATEPGAGSDSASAAPTGSVDGEQGGAGTPGATQTAPDDAVTPPNPTATGGSTTPDSNDVNPDSETPASACESAAIDPGPAPLRLLSREQYENTLTSLFGSVPDLSTALSNRVPSLDIGAGQGDVSQVELEDFQRAAEVVAASAAAGDALTTLAPCSEDRDGRDCARDFIVDFGARAYRAPITDEADIERHLELFDVGNETDFRHGIELLLRGMLQSSRFLYKVELGSGEPEGSSIDGAGSVRLSGYELAARLSYAFWQAPPDAALIQAAEDGSLGADAGLESAATRVLQDPRAAATVRGFLEALVHLGALRSLSKDAALYPEWQNGALASSLEGQARHFFDHVLNDEQGQLSSLLVSPRVYVDATLAPYYGVELEADENFEPLDVNETAAGLLTLPAFLAWAAKPDESSPIYRGKFVREMLLCQVPPAPPAKIPPAPEVDPNVSTRERLKQHEVDPGCSGCHSLLDPIGLGFEHFDAIGRYRKEDGGEPVDARGEIIGTRSLDGEFDGVQELATRLSDSDEVRACIARQYFRYVLSRFDVKQDACSLERLTSAFVDAGADLNTLPSAIVKTSAFSHRRALQLNPAN